MGELEKLKFTDIPENIEPLPINPRGSYTAEELRDILDGRLEDKQIREAINQIITLLAGKGGAAEIGAKISSNSEVATVQEALYELEDSKANADEVEILSAGVETICNMLNDKAEKSVVDTMQENITASIEGKVDKVSGKGLSEADFTHTEKSKLFGIEVGAQQNKVNTVCGVQPQGGNVTLTAANVPAAQGDDFSVAYYIDMLTRTTDELIDSQGDIGSALDSILAIENSLIGGEGA